MRKLYHMNRSNITDSESVTFLISLTALTEFSLSKTSKLNIKQLNVGIRRYNAGVTNNTLVIKFLDKEIVYIENIYQTFKVKKVLL